ncbi:MAG TPA: amidohydrolase/deacetylase family metallohydrolase [Candidatus Acidoferrum sp.]|nr:amidohydrolase/deacetylase family metallohydrolase [Candidatus Acidoferrum sp.]
MYDLLIKGGSVIDPVGGLQEVADLAIERGRIVSVAKDIPRDLSWEVLDASGHLVTPGLIDLHVHVYPGVSHYGIDPDSTCLARGVTTVCDAGSSGADTFEGLRRYVIEVSATRVLAFLNISAIGMVSPLDNELHDLKHASPERAIGVCERHRDVIQGVKVRLSRSMVGDNGLQPLLLARRAAEAAGMPLMVHVGDTPSPLGEILSELRPRDILTHCFHGRKHGILDEKGEVLPEVREAVKRGVVLDVGHGVGSFSFEVARRALKAGLTPGTISSDLHFYNVNGPVFDLATTMSKFLLLGLPLSDVLAKTTTTPAALLGLSDRVGSLREGYLADVAVFKICRGDFEFEDSMHEKVRGDQRLEPVAVIRGGRVYRSQLRLERKYGHRF